MQKKIIYIMAISLFLPIFNANAEVIELNNQDAAICLKQLKDNPSDVAIIIDYSPTCGGCISYEPIYQKVALEHPERKFFRVKQWETSDAVKKDCLQETGPSAVPRTKYVVKLNHEGKTYIFNPLKVLTAPLSEAALVDFIKDWHPSSSMVTFPSSN